MQTFYFPFYWFFCMTPFCFKNILGYSAVWNMNS